MLRFRTAIFVFICAAASVCAGYALAADPAAGASDTLYLHTHLISTSYDSGKIKANNHLRISGRTDRDLSFMLTTIADEGHECILEGKATRIDGGGYEYSENKCRMVFTFNADEVDLRVKGADGNYCTCGDLRTGHGCGYHTSIGSGIYKKDKKQAGRSSR